MFRSYFQLLSFLFVLLTACNNDAIIGLDLRDDDLLIRTQIQDTFSIETEIILLDSIRTDDSAANNIFAGQVSQPTGKVYAEAYMELGLLGGRFGTNVGKLDSISFRLGYNYVYGDTNTVITLQLRELSTNLDTAAYYRQDKKFPQGSVIGTASFKPTFAKGKNFVEIKLATDFQNKIFAERRNTTFTKNDNFRDFFKGFHLTIDAQNTYIGFNPRGDSTRFLIHYTDSVKVNNKDTIGARIYGGLEIGKRFSHISPDWSGSALKNLTTSNTLPSANFDNTFLVQPALGIATYIKFPHLQDFAANGRRVMVNLAELIVEPLPNSITPNRIPTQLLYLGYANGNKRPFRNRIAALNTNYLIESVGYLAGGYNYSYFSNNFTDYAQGIVSGLITNEGLVLVTPRGDLSIGQLLVGDSKNTNRRVKLKMYYTVLSQ